MMNFNSRTWVRKIIDSPARQAIPIVTYPGLHLTGKAILDLVTNGEEQARCIELLAKRFRSAAGVMVMDLSVEAEAFGAPVHFSPTEIPTVSGRLVSDAEGILQLKVPEVGAGRTGEYLKAAALVAQNVTDRPVFGGTIGPYSLAGRLFDITEMMTHILLDPESSEILLSKCTEFLIQYARAYKKAGMAGIVMAEPAAGLLSPEDCLEFSSKYVKKIVDAVQDDSFMIILHNCGNTVPLIPALLATGCRAFHFGNAVSMTDILPQLPADVLALGNIDPAGVFKMSDAATIKAKTKALLEACKAYPNFVPSSGCDIPPGTSLLNIEAFYQAVGEFNNI
jgi:uroporphyrinogen decarboxylase